MHIDQVIKPEIREIDDHPCPNWCDELRNIGFVHNAEKQWRTILRVVPSTACLTACCFVLWSLTHWPPLMFFAIAGAIFLFSILNTGVREVIQMRLMRPDVFIGYTFDQGEETPSNVVLAMTGEVSPFVLQLSAFLWPTWGPISVIPPNPKTDFARAREIWGFRGAQWPFAVRVVDDSDWRSGVEQILSRCKLAIFDMTHDPGDGLLWERCAAERVLGRERIATIEATDNEQAQVSVNGAVLPVPAEIKTIFPEHSDVHQYRFLILCTLRRWVANELPVHKHGLRRRQIFVLVDRLLCKWTWILLLIAPFLIVVGFCWLLVSTIKYAIL